MTWRLDHALRVMLFVLGSIGAQRSAAACASCGCGDPTLTAMGVEKPFKNRVRLALETRVTAHDDDREQLILSRTTFAAAWSPSSWLTLGAALPVPAGQVQVGEGPPRRFGGLGDLELYARPLVFRERRFAPRHLISLLAGIKFPTGPRINDSTGYPLSDDLQPGSGSFDPIFGMSYGYFGDALSVFSSISYRHTTIGRNGYRRGAVIAATAMLSRSVHRVLATGVGLDVSHTRPDVIREDYVLSNTGGTVLAITPQLLLALHRDLLLRAAVQLPLGQWWNGEQTEYPTAIVSWVLDI